MKSVRKIFLILIFFSLFCAQEALAVKGAVFPKSLSSLQQPPKDVGKGIPSHINISGQNQMDQSTLNPQETTQNTRQNNEPGSKKSPYFDNFLWLAGIFAIIIFFIFAALLL